MKFTKEQVREKVKKCPLPGSEWVDSSGLRITVLGWCNDVRDDEVLVLFSKPDGSYWCISVDKFLEPGRYTQVPPKTEDVVEESWW